jgi:hypothetical protein
MIAKNLCSSTTSERLRGTSMSLARFRLLIPERLYGREREVETLLEAYERVRVPLFTGGFGDRKLQNRENREISRN